jgi:hypothetical protein
LRIGFVTTVVTVILVTHNKIVKIILVSQSY